VDIGCLDKNMTVADLMSYISAINGDMKNIAPQTLPLDYPMKKNKQDYNVFRFIQNIVRWIYNIRIENDKVLPNDGGYIICSNHVSNFDYLFLTLNFKWERFSKFCCMAKKELFSKKSLSVALAKIAGMIPVDRSGFANSAFTVIREKLKENWGVLIHPEGSRSDNGEITIFKKGAALLSIEANVPIVPAYIDGGYEVYPKSKKLPHLFNWKKMKKYRVNIKYGEPIFPKKLNADELIKVVESAVMQLKYGTNADAL
jgi:1-acyl-sn-glycerol-3-phosphate acyltransferase